MEQPPPASLPRKVLLAGMMGNVLEWYDFGLYGYFAPVLAELFFPTENRLTSLIATFGVFAAGFLMRPLGAILFGHFGDRVGRKTALAASVILMVVPTGLIGLLPTYAQVGVLAPALLVVLRLLQGLSVGGEYGGSIVFLVESGPPHARGRCGSWVPVSATLGVLLGSGVGVAVTRFLSPEELAAWGWRLPFLGGILLGLAGLWFRTGIDETPSFRAVENSDSVARFPIVESVRTYWRELLSVAGLSVLVGAAFYLTFVYMVTYLSAEIPVKVPLTDALTINTLGMLVMLPLYPLFGALSDRVGRKPVQLVGTVGTLVLAYPLFVLMEGGEFATDLACQCVFGVLAAAIIGPLPAQLVEIVPARARYSVLSVGYNLALAVFGGAAPLMATFLIQETGDLASPSFYLMVAAGVTLITLLLIRETYRDKIH